MKSGIDEKPKELFFYLFMYFFFFFSVLFVFMKHSCSYPDDNDCLACETAYVTLLCHQ